MTFVDFRATPDDFGPIRASDLHEGLGASLGAQALDSLDPQSGVSAFQVWRRARAAYAGGEALPGLNMPDTPSAQDLAVNQQVRDEIPDVPIADAKARVKQEGLDGLLPLPDQPSIKQPVLDLMIDEAHEHRNRQVAIDRGPHGFAAGALGFATSIGAGMIDPVNIAAFSMPVLGEARWGQMLAGAGDSLVARAGARAVQGAAQGAVGTAVLQPAEWLLHTADGRDYTMAEALRSVALGAGMGAAFHAGLGGIGDLRARAKGLPLPGSTDETLTRALQPQSETQLEAPGGALRSPDEARSVAGANSEAAGAPPEPAATPEALPPGHPAHVLADLPEMAREDVHRAATADVIAGRPVRVGEMLQEAAKEDPRIAESVAPLRSETSVVINGEETRLANGRPVEQTRGPQSLLQFIAAGGGISSKDPLLNDFLQALGGKKSLRGAGKLVSPDGVPLDRMREAAVEAGYLHDPGRDNGGVSQSTIRDLIDAVDGEARGRKVYPQGEVPELTAAEKKALEIRNDEERKAFFDQAGQEVDRLLDERGVTTIRPQLRQRALTIMAKEGIRDPHDVVDRVLDEFDVAGNRPQVGESDHAHWEQFKDARPDYEDPQAVAESNEAARAPEPASMDPAKAPSAAEQKAIDAERVLENMRPMLTEKERADIDDLLGQIDRDREERADIIKDGAACLAAAIG